MTTNLTIHVGGFDGTEKINIACNGDADYALRLANSLVLGEFTVTIDRVVADPVEPPKKARKAR